MNKIKNSMFFIYGTKLVPLILSIVLGLLFIRNQPDTMGIISILFSMGSLIYYVFGIMFIGDDSNISILPYGYKKIYSKYGTFFLLEKKSSDSYKSFHIYENKYWLYLNKISNNKVTYLGDIESFNEKIKNALENDISENKSQNKVESDLKNWHGIIDIESRRDKNIEELIK